MVEPEDFLDINIIRPSPYIISIPQADDICEIADMSAVYLRPHADGLSILNFIFLSTWGLRWTGLNAIAPSLEPSCTWQTARGQTSRLQLMSSLATVYLRVTHSGKLLWGFYVTALVPTLYTLLHAYIITTSSQSF